MDKSHKTEHLELLKTNPMVTSKFDLKVIINQCSCSSSSNLEAEKWAEHLDEGLGGGDVSTGRLMSTFMVDRRRNGDSTTGTYIFNVDGELVKDAVGPS